ncbi:[Pyruvate dehydrogenase (acetyl-transferring)] kinase [Drechslerella dactyloides]|uniref:Protein-serine/threonine kinase n=1 Tax=Drechslerella dactyloides TaxID=74499 RepID=A0AAD6IX25_DREDA|nr:[Pyruvate dehydrogenase (acetyl-transferring)] kinase [Drechslerella dactyloides]
MQSSWRMSRSLLDKISHYSNFPATPVSLRQMVQFGQNPSPGTLFRASQFLSEELPIRLAHRVKELNNLPDGLGEMPSIQKVANWYAQSFEEITTLPKLALSPDIKDALVRGTRGAPLQLSVATENPSITKGMYSSSPVYGNGNNGARKVAAAGRYVPENTPNLQGVQDGSGSSQRPQGVDGSESEHSRYYATIDEGVRWPPEILEYNKNFTQTLKTIKKRHDPVLTTVALGINEYKRQRRRTGIDDNIQSFLDRFYMSRIGIRMLIGQHVALNEMPCQPDHVGIICTKTNVKELAEEAIENARYICQNYYGLFSGPQVQLVCRDDLNFMYVPGHLSHMLFETLKNSMRAVVESHGVDNEEYPPVKVIVAEGKEDITIKISDEGGGIPRSAIPLVWTYMYTTVDKTPDIEDGYDNNDFKAPLAGFGYGLPISRLYARYFGGDLKLISMEGYGTDVYLHLNRLSTSSEPLN